MRYHDPERIRQPVIFGVDAEVDRDEDEEGVERRRTRRWPLPEKGVDVDVGEAVLVEVDVAEVCVGRGCWGCLGR